MDLQWEERIFKKEAKVRGFQAAEMVFYKKRSLYTHFFPVARGLSLQLPEPMMTLSAFFRCSKIPPR